MASKRRPKSSRRVSKAELRQRAKKGWVTRRQRYSPEQIRRQASKGGNTQALYEENRRLQEELRQIRQREASLEEQARATQAALEAALGEISHYAQAVDPVYDARRKHFSEEQYLVLFSAEHNRDFEEKARVVSAQTGLTLKEVYTNWMSPE